MKVLKNSKVIRICVILMALGFMVSGCATCASVKQLQAQVDAVSLKADNAMAAAVAAQKTADDCCATADKANQAAKQAADRAAAAADRAENAAAKAEAVFMKHMKK